MAAVIFISLRTYYRQRSSSLYQRSGLGNALQQLAWDAAPPRLRQGRRQIWSVKWRALSSNDRRAKTHPSCYVPILALPIANTLAPDCYCISDCLSFGAEIIAMASCDVIFIGLLCSENRISPMTMPAKKDRDDRQPFYYAVGLDSGTNRQLLIQKFLIASGH